MNRIQLKPWLKANHHKYTHHVDGGEQDRIFSITWLGRTLEVRYVSPWRRNDDE